MQSKGLKSLLQHHCSKASLFQRSAFFTVQLSHPYMTTGKTIALTKQTFVKLIKKKKIISQAGKESTCNVGNLGLMPGLGSSPGEWKGYPLQYSGLENSMDCIVNGVAKNWTRLRDLKKKKTHISTHCPLEKPSLRSTIYSLHFARQETEARRGGWLF